MAAPVGEHSRVPQWDPSQTIGQGLNWKHSGAGKQTKTRDSNITETLGLEDNMLKSQEKLFPLGRYQLHLRHAWVQSTVADTGLHCVKEGMIKGNKAMFPFSPAAHTQIQKHEVRKYCSS